MKKLLLSTVITAVSFYAYAQTNTFPSSGNVGIGTTTPIGRLQVQEGSYDLLIGGAFVDIGLNGTTGSWARAFRVVDTSNSNGLDGGAFGVTGTGATPAYAYMAIPTANSTGYNSTKILVLTNSGNVGIGTTAPTSTLSVKGATADASANSLNVQNSSSAHLFTLRNDGEFSFGTKLTMDQNGYITSNGRLIIANAVSSTNVVLTVKGAATAQLNDLQEWQNGSGSVLDKVDKNGNVGIGTTTPQYPLDVYGTIHSKEVNVDLTGTPDYVFDKDYHLPTLAETEAYINQNHHLAEIPSADEVAKNGLNLGEMNKLLLKKVEELTLYLIEKDKKEKEQEARISKLEGEFKNLVKHTSTKD